MTSVYNSSSTRLALPCVPLLVTMVFDVSVENGDWFAVASTKTPIVRSRQDTICSLSTFCRWQAPMFLSKIRLVTANAGPIWQTGGRLETQSWFLNLIGAEKNVDTHYRYQIGPFTCFCEHHYWIERTSLSVIIMAIQVFLHQVNWENISHQVHI